MILAIIQARMSSSRLPGKTLLTLGDTTVLGNVIRRVQRSKEVHGVMVATSFYPSDDDIIRESIHHGALTYRGDLEDVLDRYYKAATLYRADKIVRITADCPFIMPDIIDKVIQESHLKDYASNTIERTYPRGLDCEVFTYDELERAHKLAIDSEREHVTPYIIDHAMHKKSVMDTDNISDSRMTLDYQDDLDYLRRIYSKVGDIYNYEDFKGALSEITN